MCVSENVDYVGESTDVTYFPSIVEVFICENVTITDDFLEEEIELFGVTLTTTDPSINLLISSGVIIIVDNDGQCVCVVETRYILYSPLQRQL